MSEKRKKSKADESTEEGQPQDVGELFRPARKAPKTIEDVLMPRVYDPQTGVGTGIDPNTGLPYKFRIPSIRCGLPLKNGGECGRLFMDQAALEHHRNGLP